MNYDEKFYSEILSFISRKCMAPNPMSLKNIVGGLPGGAVVENLPANAGNTGSSPGPGRCHMPRSD